MRGITVIGLLLFQCSTQGAFAQGVGIGTTTPNPRAILELKSSNKGFLLPRVMLTGSTDNSTIPNAPFGLMIINEAEETAEGQGIYMQVSGAATPTWRKLGFEKSGWLTTGNFNSVGAKIGHNDDVPLQFIVNGNHVGRLGGNSNILFGLNSGANLSTTENLSSQNNIIIGNNAFATGTAGTNNVAIGNGAMQNATGGGTGIAIGGGALRNQANGAMENIAIGFSSQQATTTGNNNISMGRQSLIANTTGADNLALGFGALQTNAGNNRSTAVGHFALQNGDGRASGRPTYNTAVGYASLSGGLPANNNTGRWNTAVGDSSLGQNTSGNDNIAMGAFALRDNTSGNNNIAIGRSALMLNTIFGNNIAMGDSVLYRNGEGSALAFTARQNVGIGNHALRNNGSGYDNTVVGARAAFSNDIGGNNVAIGTDALLSNGSGSGNTAVGRSSLQGASGSGNIGIGSGAGRKENTGNNNVFIGVNAGNTIEGNVSARLFIESSATNGTVPLIYGDFVADSIELNAKTINRNLFGLKGIGDETGIELGYGLSGKQGNAGKIGYSLATLNAIDFYGGGTSIGTRAIKFWAEGGSTFTGPVNVDGFTRLGTLADAAPMVKMKKINVIGPGISAFASYVTGITDAKILGVQIMMTYSSTWKIPPNYTEAPGYEYNYLVQNGRVVIINQNGNSANIGSKPVTILITYEE